MDDLTVLNIASQNELRNIHEGIISNTVKIMSDSDLTSKDVKIWKNIVNCWLRK